MVHFPKLGCLSGHTFSPGQDWARTENQEACSLTLWYIPQTKVSLLPWSSKRGVSWARSVCDQTKNLHNSGGNPWNQRGVVVIIYHQQNSDPICNQQRAHLCFVFQVTWNLQSLGLPYIWVCLSCSLERAGLSVWKPLDTPSSHQN